jgi:hydroxymethylpyrimidine/phosphomethylpyrimidine kinase
MNAPPIALTIAGSDSSGGAGIQADLKTFSALTTYGASAITAITAQNTRGVTGIELTSPAMIAAQIEAVFSDLDVRAVKIGMVGNEAAIDAIAQSLSRWCRVPIVLDPVMVSTSGAQLMEDGAQMALLTRLVPMATLITPNLVEAAKLLGASPAVDEQMMVKQAELLIAFGSRAVLLTGGDRSSPEAVDFLFDGHETLRLAAPRILTRNTHGTGCRVGRHRHISRPRAPASRSRHQAKTYLTSALAKPTR